MKEQTGRYQGSGRGFGFVIPDGATPRENDYFIPPDRSGGAWDGDLVAVRPEEGDAPGRRIARVVAVKERANRTVTGRLCKTGREVWLMPDNGKLPGGIKLTGKPNGARVGDKVALDMVSYGTHKTPPFGTLRAVFGRDGERESTVAAILFEYGIVPDFPSEVEAEADRAASAIEKAEAPRTDLRGKTIFTIDGAGAKDLDDAVSLERDAAGNRILGVHIADVSHYVTHNSPLDREAFERGTSVYFANRVVPMLPPVLSNGVCSLHPQVDRLTISCTMTIDSAGVVTGHKIEKSIIRTVERMTYEDCNVLLAGGDADLEVRYENILPILRELHELAKILTKKRRLRGALTLESTERAILCDEAGVPVEIVPRAAGVSEGIIEECMLAANETVAGYLTERGAPGVFRIHEKPSLDKTETLRAMLAPLGYDLPIADGFSLQKVIDRARGKPESAAVNMMLLRSLMKARYEGRNAGHFGLAAEYYCHFTSPIRRYPDLVVHRVLTALLEGAAIPPRLASFCQRAATQSSEREVAATTAEREIEKRYMAEYMASRIGETFAGVVSGVARFGLFVTMENGVEGLLRTESLPDDAYDYDETHLTLRGVNKGTHYGFGMALEVTCAAADVASGQIDLVPAGQAVLTPPRAPTQEKRPRPPKKTGGAGRKNAPRGRSRRK